VTAAPVTIHLETDIHSDVDDAGALAVACALADRGLVRIAGVGVNTPSRWGPPAVDAILRARGWDDVPIGALHPADDSVAERDYARVVAERHPHRDGPWPASAGLLLDTLAAAPDRGITVVSIGFFANLVAALDLPGGRDEVARAVGRTVVMGGAFPHGSEFNIAEHPATARRFVDEWPGAIEFLPFDAGVDVITGTAFADPDADDPVAAAYARFDGPGRGRPSWDLLTIDLAVRGAEGRYALSGPGRVSVAPDGTSDWHDDEHGRHRYVERVLVPDIVRELDALLARPAPSAAVTPTSARSSSVR
jgi:purine nucleosidase